MRLLLDSHVLLWWNKDVGRLSSAQHAAIGNPANEIFVSAATAWELGIKTAAGKLTITEPIPQTVRHLGFRELPITLRHGEIAAALPLHHKDPFDRMLVAQAIAEEMTLVTIDRRLSAYAGAMLLT